MPSPAPSPGSSQSLDRSTTKAFLQSRINSLLLNDPSNTSLLNRSDANAAASGAGSDFAEAASGLAPRGLAAGAGTGFMGPVAMGLGSPLGRSPADRMNFGASRFDDADPADMGSQTIQFLGRLSEIARNAAKEKADKEAALLGYSGGVKPSYTTASPYDIWVEGRYSGFSDDAGGLDRNGHVGVIYAGADYKPTENVLIGMLAEVDWAKDSSDVLQTDVNGTGWMAGPYLSARIHGNIYLDLRAAWGTSSNDLTIGTTAAGFDTSRWLVRGQIAGNWVHEAWRFTPTADLAYIDESQDAFTNSAGVFVAGQNVSLGRLQFGPEVGYRFVHNDGTVVEPFGSIKGVWDFDNPNVAIIDGFVVGPGDFWGRIEGGLLVVAPEGWSARGLASYDGLGASDFHGYTLQGELTVPFN